MTQAQNNYTMQQSYGKGQLRLQKRRKCTSQLKPPPPRPRDWVGDTRGIESVLNNNPSRGGGGLNKYRLLVCSPPRDTRRTGNKFRQNGG